jgi:glutamate-1-semialdehyde 2,1-aminomutase
VFLLSTTHGAEGHCLAAGLAVMRFYREHGVVERLYAQGERLAAGIRREVAARGLGEHFQLLGRPCNLVYATRDEQGQPSQPFRTLFLQEMIKRGFLVPSLVVSHAHGDAEIDATVRAIAEALEIYRKALDQGVEKYLESRSVKPVFRAYN